MEIKNGTLVIVRRETNSCWGLVVGDFPSDVNFTVKIRKTDVPSTIMNRLRPDMEQIIVPRADLRPVLQTDGSYRTPERVLAKFRNQILLRFCLELSESKFKEYRHSRLKEDVLAIVLGSSSPGIQIKPCWGVITAKLANGNYEIQIGRIEKVVCQPDQLIPVLATDGSSKNPKIVVKKRRDDILRFLINKHDVQQGNDALRHLITAIKGDEFLL